MPAPAGAITVLLPIYVQFLGLPWLRFAAPLTFLYTIGIALLMVSRLPVYSGKKFGTRVSPESVLPVFVFVVAFFALLLSYPWEVLTAGTVLFLLSLPIGWWSYGENQRRSAKGAAAQPAVAQPGSGEPDIPADAAPAPQPPNERPSRLN
jgi:CDP-diacylglycerol--serine O-phosphatidyltransferase